jgi:hypothetical protein
MHAVIHSMVQDNDDGQECLRAGQEADNGSCSTQAEVPHSRSTVLRVGVDVSGFTCIQRSFWRFVVSSSCSVTAAVLHWKVEVGLCSATSRFVAAERSTTPLGNTTRQQPSGSLTSCCLVKQQTGHSSMMDRSTAAAFRTALVNGNLPYV